ncbi:CNTN3 protein, partial [Atlantisia rogersi]|nr:CNTN3 protein [Atlantisia rogersi]
PVPQINWRRTDGLPFPSKIKLRKANGMIEIPNFQQEDAGLYECITENSRGKNIARGRLTYYAKPHWIQTIKDTEAAVEDTLNWDCRASGKPKPSYRWLKNGDQLTVEGRIQIENGVLTISNLNLTDSGRYQCIAENKHGVIHSSAELRVVASAPDFSKNPMKKLIQVQIGSTVDFECKPKASPKAKCSWKKGGEQLHENER